MAVFKTYQKKHLEILKCFSELDALSWCPGNKTNVTSIFKIVCTRYENWNRAVCSACGEEEETPYNFLGSCSVETDYPLFG